MCVRIHIYMLNLTYIFYVEWNIFEWVMNGEKANRYEKLILGVTFQIKVEISLKMGKRHYV